jgi:predicted metal-binding membrane protein
MMGIKCSIGINKLGKGKWVINNVEFLLPSSVPEFRKFKGKVRAKTNKEAAKALQVFLGYSLKNWANHPVLRKALIKAKTQK